MPASAVTRAVTRAVAVLLAVVGCGQAPEEPRATVSGRVLHRGQPVKQAAVLFENAALGVAIFCDVDDEGRFDVGTYDASGLKPGQYQVAVLPRPAARSDTPIVGEQQPALDDSAIPDSARDVVTSGLRANVTAAGPNHFEFELGTK